MAESQTDNEPSTCLSLIVRLQRQDSSAWRQLADLYGPLVYSWVRLSGLNEHDAADITQDVFVAVHGSVARFQKARPSDRFRDWLWTITRRRTCDFLRKVRQHTAAKGGTDAYQQLQEFPEHPPGEDDAGVCSAEAELVRKALSLVRNEFEERTWQACLQTTIEGRRPADVAADLGMSVGALYVARSRVLKRIRQELGDVV